MRFLVAALAIGLAFLLDGLDGVITGCAVAIAETGTIILDAGPDQGRRALSLLPDRHLCVVRVDQIVGSVPEALARLDPRRPLTWIGQRSYSIYLWHWPVLELTRPGIDVPLHGPVLFALQLAATIALADLSYRYVEQPFRRSTSWQHPDWLRIGRVGIAVGVTSVVLIVGWSGIAPSGHPGQLRVASAQITPHSVSIRPEGASHPISVTRAVSDQSNGIVPVKAGGKESRDAAKPVAVLALGDSVMVDARSGLARLLGPKLTLNASVGRQPAEIISLLHGYAAHQKLPNNVVLQMGNNGPVYSDDLEKLHAALRGVPHVYLVNVEVPRSWQGEVNSVLSQAADNWGQAQLVDWHAVASSHGGITTDGIHLTEKGIELYSRLVAASVRTAASKAS